MLEKSEVRFFDPIGVTPFKTKVNRITN